MASERRGPGLGLSDPRRPGATQRDMRIGLGAACWCSLFDAAGFLI
ncbi:hypothetical protein DB30_02281 [Enhygromyxa salina]|uniref:Uncharacterized protein n=1 Tax=Enhygromyxa salina TaxID=215803 RepID=A0A0C1ZM18_9BACT|nr:hypothetical protein DB30_02281 [Enhygromyxa salina]